MNKFKNYNFMKWTGEKHTPRVKLSAILGKMYNGEEKRLWLIMQLQASLNYSRT